MNFDLEPEILTPQLFRDANRYQKNLEQAVSEMGELVRELDELMKVFGLERAALLLQSKTGVEYKGKLIKPSNQDERDALIMIVMPEEETKRVSLENRIHFLKQAVNSHQSLISVEQSKMAVERKTAELLKND